MGSEMCIRDRVGTCSSSNSSDPRGGVVPDGCGPGHGGHRDQDCFLSSSPSTKSTGSSFLSSCSESCPVPSDISDLKSGTKIQIESNVNAVLRDLSQIQCSTHEVRHILDREWENRCNEVLAGSTPFVQEIFTDTEPVRSQATSRGHATGELSLIHI